MKNDYFSKWGLFISSYLPLYFWLFLSNINYKKVSKAIIELIKTIIERNIVDYIKKNVDMSDNLNSFWVVFFVISVVLISVSIYQTVQLFIGSGSEVYILPKDMKINPESDSLMNYVVTYFTPLLSFDIHNFKSIMMNVLLFLLIGFMYVGSSAMYLNPVLGIFGYKVYAVSGMPKAHHIISKLTFDEIETDKTRRDEIERYKIVDGIYIIKPKKENN